MKKIPVCLDSELREGFPRSVKLMTREIVVFRHGADVYAREGACKHMGASLVKSGKWDGSRVTCGWHGWSYDMISGACVGKADVCLKTFATEITDGRIYVVIDG